LRQVTALVYPLLSLPNKTDDFKAEAPETRTLDGAAYLANAMPDDYAAMQFLGQVAPGVIVEAVGGQYSEYARVATYTGLPGVLGWPGHESQWRGGAAEMGSREADIKTLYTTFNWDDAQAIVKKYNIRYIYFGPLEAQTYAVYADKFDRHLGKIYQAGSVVVYEVP